MDLLKTLFLTLLLSSTFLCYSQENFIQLKGGEKLSFEKVELIYEEYKEPFFKTNTSKVFTPEEVESFQNENGFFIKNDYTTSKRDFALRVLEGKIEIYKYDYSYNFLLANGNPSRDYFVYKTDLEDLKKLNYDNLAKDLKSNAESIKCLNKIRTVKRISPVFYIIGGAGLATSALLFYNKNNLATPTLLVSSAIITIPFLLTTRNQKRMVDAIKIYNGN